LGRDMAAAGRTPRRGSFSANPVKQMPDAAIADMSGPRPFPVSPSGAIGLDRYFLIRVLPTRLHRPKDQLAPRRYLGGRRRWRALDGLIGPLELGDGAEGATLKLTHGLNIPRICDRTSRNRTRQTTVAADSGLSLPVAWPADSVFAPKVFRGPFHDGRREQAASLACTTRSSNRGLRV
jgi:hypothetical protein